MKLCIALKSSVQNTMKHKIFDKGDVIVSQISDANGGGYEAYVEELGRWSLNGCGDTPEEALQDLYSEYEEYAKEV